jgi:hypothetical protein
MAMDDIDAFSNADLAEDAHDEHEGGERVLTREGKEGEMIDFHSIGDIADTKPFLRVSISHDDYLVSSFNQALAELKHVHFDTPKVGEEVVTHKEHAVPARAVCLKKVV